MDQLIVWYTVAFLVIAVPLTVLFAFRSPAQFEQSIKWLTFWYNIFVLIVFTCLLGGAMFFALGAVWAERHDLFFWLYMFTACVFGAFGFLNFATKHRSHHDLGVRIADLFRETSRQWRERFGCKTKPRSKFAPAAGAGQEGKTGSPAS